MRSAKSAAAIGETAAASGTTNGNAVAFEGANSNASTIRVARIGVLQNDPANLTAQTDLFLRIHELHIWTGPVLKSHPAEALAVITRLNEKYGVA